MTVSEMVVHNKHITSVYIYSVISPEPFIFIMDACPGYILESTKGGEMKLSL